MPKTLTSILGRFYHIENVTESTATQHKNLDELFITAPCHVSIKNALWSKKKQNKNKTNKKPHVTLSHIMLKNDQIMQCSIPTFQSIFDYFSLLCMKGLIPK